MGYCAICTAEGQHGNPLFCQLSRLVPIIGDATQTELVARGITVEFVTRLSDAMAELQKRMGETGCDPEQYIEAAARLEILRTVFITNIGTALTS